MPWEESQPDGPEPQQWKTPVHGPHGYVEPSKTDLLAGMTARRQWRFLLSDSKPSNAEWWARLMRFLRLHHGW